MAMKISTQHGAESMRGFLRGLDTEAPEAFAIDTVFGEPGRKYGDNSAPNTPAEGTFRKLVFGHNEYEDRITALEQAVLRGPFG